MGPVISSIKKLFVKEDKVAAGGLDDHNDGPKRRRNSLAFHITQFCRYEEDDYQPLVEETVADIERTAHELGKYHKRQARESKMVKAARAIQGGDMRVLREQIVINFKNINRKFLETHGGDTLLHMVCREGYYDMVAFIENPKNHSEFDDTQLMVNIRNENGRTPIMLCFTAPSATCCGMQFGVLPNGNANSQPPEGLEEISDWIKPGGPNMREKCVRLLLKSGALVNDKDFHNFTILHYACIWGWVSTVQLLLEYDADVNAQTVTGKTPLHFAVEYGHLDIVRLLGKQKNLLKNACDTEGTSAFVIAAEAQDVELMQLLLDIGCDIDSVTYRRKSALSLACERQDLEAINWLFDRKVQRRGSALALLEGACAEAVFKRIEDEEKHAQEEQEKQEKLAAEGALNLTVSQYTSTRQKSPYGAWVEYNDKRTNTPFYYNTVTRASVKKKPKDFIAKKGYIVKDAIFGMSFYH